MTDTKAESLLLKLMLEGYQIIQKKVTRRSNTENIIRVNELHENQQVIILAVPKTIGIFNNLGNKVCQDCFGIIKDNCCIQCGKKY